MSATAETAGGFGRRTASWIVRDARRDQFRPAATWLVFWAPVAGWLMLAVLFVVARPAFYLLQQEDHVVEWLQFALCLFSAVAAGVALWQLQFSPRVAAAFLLLLALGCFFLAGEEISWAQRVIGIETPPALAEANRQSETNLHNIDIGLDPQLLFKLASVGLGLLGLVGIVAVRVLGQGGDSAQLLAPPAATIPGFVGIVVYWLIMFATGNAVAPLLRFQEWVECALYISLAASVIAVVLRSAGRAPAGRRSARSKLLYVGVGVAVLTVLFAVLTPLSGITPGNV